MLLTRRPSVVRGLPLGNDVRRHFFNKESGKLRKTDGKIVNIKFGLSYIIYFFYY